METPANGKPPSPAAGTSPARSNRPLVATRWRIVSVNAGGSTMSPPAQPEAFLEFTADGKVGGNTGCNSFGGPAERRQSTVVIGRLISTKKACAGDVMTIEAAILSTLEGEIRYTIDGDNLALTAASGNRITLRATA